MGATSRLMVVRPGLSGFIPLRLDTNAYVHVEYGNASFNGVTGAIDLSVDPSDVSGAFVLTHANAMTRAGDFDVRIRYTLNNFPIPTTADAYAQLLTRMVDPTAGPGANTVAIGLRQRQASPQRVFRGYTSDGGSSTYVERPVDCYTTSWFRYIRRGATVSAYYLTGGVWTYLVGRSDCNSAPWEIRLSLGQFAVLDTYTAGLDNLVVTTPAGDAP